MRERVIVVILSVCHALILENTDNFRYELTQDEDLRPFIVLHFFISGLSLRKQEAFSSAVSNSFYGQRPLASRHNHVSK